MSSILGTLDPTKGFTSTQGLLDPGGKIVKKLTGSDIASRVADPGNLIVKDEGGLSSAEKKRISQLRREGQAGRSRIFGSSLIR